MNMTQNEVYNITDVKVSDNAAYSICKQQNDAVYEEIDNMWISGSCDSKIIIIDKLNNHIPVVHVVNWVHK